MADPSTPVGPAPGIDASPDLPPTGLPEQGVKGPVRPANPATGLGADIGEAPSGSVSAAKIGTGEGSGAVPPNMHAASLAPEEEPMDEESGDADHAIGDPSRPWGVEIPEGWSWRAPEEGETPSDAQVREYAVARSAFNYGLTLPPPDFVSVVLRYLGIGPYQLKPVSYYLVTEFVRICKENYIIRSLRLLKHVLKLNCDQRDPGSYYFSAQKGFRIVTTRPSGGWQGQWFFVTPPEGARPSFPSWGECDVGAYSATEELEGKEAKQLEFLRSYYGARAENRVLPKSPFRSQKKALASKGKATPASSAGSPTEGDEGDVLGERPSAPILVQEEKGGGPAGATQKPPSGISLLKSKLGKRPAVREGEGGGSPGPKRACVGSPAVEGLKARLRSATASVKPSSGSQPRADAPPGATVVPVEDYERIRGLSPAEAEKECLRAVTRATMLVAHLSKARVAKEGEVADEVRQLREEAGRLRAAAEGEKTRAEKAIAEARERAAGEVAALKERVTTLEQELATAEDKHAMEARDLIAEVVQQVRVKLQERGHDAKFLDDFDPSLWE